jgi:hypothetical protein
MSPHIMDMFMVRGGPHIFILPSRAMIVTMIG